MAVGAKPPADAKLILSEPINSVELPNGQVMTGKDLGINDRQMMVDDVLRWSMGESTNGQTGQVREVLVGVFQDERGSNYAVAEFGAWGNKGDSQFSVDPNRIYNMDIEGGKPMKYTWHTHPTWKGDSMGHLANVPSGGDIMAGAQLRSWGHSPNIRTFVATDMYGKGNYPNRPWLYEY
ncbi:MAG: hypothetical protein QNJ97_28110 [Myxococcota bacterium]|nr:hypothetical protein [Myxococcota bacterium]